MNTARKWLRSLRATQCGELLRQKVGAGYRWVCPRRLVFGRVNQAARQRRAAKRPGVLGVLTVVATQNPGNGQVLDPALGESRFTENAPVANAFDASSRRRNSAAAALLSR